MKKIIFSGLITCLTLVSSGQVKTYRYHSPYQHLSVKKMRAVLEWDELRRKGSSRPIMSDYNHFLYVSNQSESRKEVARNMETDQGIWGAVGQGLLILKGFTRYGNTANKDEHALKNEYRVRD